MKTQPDSQLPGLARNSLRGAEFRPPRSRWPGLTIAALMAAALSAVVVSSLYDDRPLAQRVDDTVHNAQQQVVQTLDDAGITAAVKAALVADPALSALEVDVSTVDGQVTLAGPVPDEKARERAGVLAAAPAGVKAVDNRLVVAPGA
jgi:osmotically-inducible protein OsmY